MTSDRWRIALIAALVVLATVLHYGIDVEAGAVHDVLLRSYYLPIVLAGLWFGARGGLITAAVVSVVFFPHALHGWQAPYTFVFLLIEILMYHVIGALTGVMSSRARLALTAEKGARLEREQAYDDLKAKTQLLFETEEQLRRTERLAALGRMSAGLAHEIRNPLSSIKTSVEMLEDKAGEDAGSDGASRTVELLQVLSEEADRLNRILTEFLQFARVETAAEGKEAARCVVGDAVASTAELLRTRLDVAGIDVSFDAADLDVVAAMSADHLRQVFLNLFLNSADALSGGGRIYVGRVGRSDPHLTLAVEDNGPGISPEVAHSIFDPFFSTKEGGVGLGLSIVARLLDSNGGDIRLDHGHQTGARFLIAVPRDET